MRNMEITSESRVRRTPDNFVNAMLDDDLVFMDVAEGQFYGLREAGLRVWQLLEDSGAWTQVQELTAALCAEFRVDEEKCLRDLAVLLDELQAVGLVELS